MHRTTKRLALLAVCGVMITSAVPAMAADGANMCLRAGDVERTEIKDARHILYHMKDGKTWSNTLKTNCPQLANGDQAYSQKFYGTDQICANSHQITVLSTGNVCTLGAFSPAE